ncbi:MAG: hypothetical protein WA891_11875 [Acidobacteriaceae bacterium]
MKKRFVIEFEDGSAKATGKKHDGITYPCSGDERLYLIHVEGVPFISGNSQGLVTLGTVLIQIGTGDYKGGFHVHLREDFDGDKNGILIVGLDGHKG